MKNLLLLLALSSSAAWAQSSGFIPGKSYTLDHWECLDVYGQKHPYLSPQFNGSNYAMEVANDDTWKSYGSIASLDILESHNSELKLQLNGKIISHGVDPLAPGFQLDDYTSINTYSNTLPKSLFVSDNPGFWAISSEFELHSNNVTAFEASLGLNFAIDGYVEKVGDEIRLFRHVNPASALVDCGLSPIYTQLPIAAFPPFTEEGIKQIPQWQNLRKEALDKIDFRKAPTFLKKIDVRSEEIPVYVISVFKEKP